MARWSTAATTRNSCVVVVECTVFFCIALEHRRRRRTSDAGRGDRGLCASRAIPQAGRFNPAGFPLHAAVHESGGSRAHVAAHVHRAALSAVAAHPDGFLPIGFLPIEQSYYPLPPIAMLPFTGFTCDLAYRAEVSAALSAAAAATTTRGAADGADDGADGDGGNSAGGDGEAMPAVAGTMPRTLLLRNHGVITLGATVAEAFTRLYYAVRAAEAQSVALAAVGGDVGRLVLPPPGVVARATQQDVEFNEVRDLVCR